MLERINKLMRSEDLLRHRVAYVAVAGWLPVSRAAQLVAPRALRTAPGRAEQIRPHSRKVREGDGISQERRAAKVMNY
jgi:hypothetical protein